MSIAIMATIFQIKDQLTPTEKLILLELADHANDQGAGIWPSLDTIKDRTSLSRTTVRETLDWLTEAGILEIVEQPTAHSSTKRRINIYYLNELLIAGQQGRKHEKLQSARAARVPVTDPQEKSQGVSERHSEGQLVTPRGSATVPRGSATDPESSIKHSLTIPETEEFAPKISPSELWDSITQQLRGDVGTADYASWVFPLRPTVFRKGKLLVEAVNCFGRDWCADHLGKKVSRLATAIAGQEITVQFILRGEA